MSYLCVLLPISHLLLVKPKPLRQTLSPKVVSKGSNPTASLEIVRETNISLSSFLPSSPQADESKAGRVWLWLGRLSPALSSWERQEVSSGAAMPVFSMQVTAKVIWDAQASPQVHEIPEGHARYKSCTDVLRNFVSPFLTLLLPNICKSPPNQSEPFWTL